MPTHVTPDIADDYRTYLDATHGDMHAVDPHPDAARVSLLTYAVQPVLYSRQANGNHAPLLLPWICDRSKPAANFTMLSIHTAAGYLVPKSASADPWSHRAVPRALRLFNASVAPVRDASYVPGFRGRGHVCDVVIDWRLPAWYKSSGPWLALFNLLARHAAMYEDGVQPGMRRTCYRIHYGIADRSPASPLGYAAALAYEKAAWSAS